MKLKRFIALLLGLVMLLSLAPSALAYSDAGRTWIVKQATCTETGIERSMDDYGNTHDRTIPKKPHSWGSWRVTEKATCGTPGSQVHTCRVCGTTQTQTIQPTYNHQYGPEIVVKEPTVFSAGLKTQECTVCHRVKETVTYADGTMIPDNFVPDRLGQIQEMLGDLGYYPRPRPNKKYDKTTQNAVEHFQEDAETDPADGLLYPDTIDRIGWRWQELGKKPNEKWPIKLKDSVGPWISNEDGTHSRVIFNWKGPHTTETMPCRYTFVTVDGKRVEQCEDCGYQPTHELKIDSAVLSLVWPTRDENTPEDDALYDFQLDVEYSGGFAYDGNDDNYSISAVLRNGGTVITTGTFNYDRPGTTGDNSASFYFASQGPGVYQADVTLTYNGQTVTAQSNPVEIKGLELKGATLSYVPEGTYDKLDQYAGNMIVDVDYAYNGQDYNQAYAITGSVVVTCNGEVVYSSDSFDTYTSSWFDIEAKKSGTYVATVTLSDGVTTLSATTNEVVVENVGLELVSAEMFYTAHVGYYEDENNRDNAFVSVVFHVDGDWADPPEGVVFQIDVFEVGKGKVLSFEKTMEGGENTSTFPFHIDPPGAWYATVTASGENMDPQTVTTDVLTVDMSRFHFGDLVLTYFPGGFYVEGEKAGDMTAVASCSWDDGAGEAQKTDGFFYTLEFMTYELALHRVNAEGDQIVATASQPVHVMNQGLSYDLHTYGSGTYYAVLTISGGDETLTLTSNTVEVKAPEWKLNGATLTYQPEGVFNNWDVRIGSGTVAVDCTVGDRTAEEAILDYDFQFSMTLYRDGEAVQTRTDIFENYLFRDGIEFDSPGNYYAVVTATVMGETQTVTSNTVEVKAPEWKLNGATLTYQPEGVFNNWDVRIGSGTVAVDCTVGDRTSEEAMLDYDFQFSMTLYRDGEAVQTRTDIFENYLFRDGIEFDGPGNYYAVVTATLMGETQTVTSNTVTVGGGLGRGALRVPYQRTDPVDIEDAPDANIDVELTVPNYLFHAGDTVPLYFTVTNVGAVPLVFLETEGLEDVEGMEFPSMLAPGQSGNAYGAYLITQEDVDLGFYYDGEGEITDEAQENTTLRFDGIVRYLYAAVNAQGEPDYWNAADDVSASLTISPYEDIMDDLVLICEYAEKAYQVGEPIVLNWTVTNVGELTLHKVTDDHNNGLVPSLPDILGPGERYAWTQTVSATQEDYEDGLLRDEEGNYHEEPNADGHAFNAVAGASITYYAEDRPEGDNLAMDECIVVVEIVPAEAGSAEPLTVEITCDYDGTVYHPSEILTVTYSMTNTTPYVLETEQMTGFTVDPVRLDPGETRTWTEEYPITQGMIEEGHYLDPVSGAETEEYQDTCIAVRGGSFVFRGQDEQARAIRADAEYKLLINLENTKGAPAQAPGAESGYDLSKGGLQLFVQVMPEDVKPFYEKDETVHLQVYVKNTGSVMLYRLSVYGGNTGGSTGMREGIYAGEMVDWGAVTIQVKDNSDGTCRIKYVAQALMTPDYTFSKIQDIPGDAPWISSEDVILYFPIAQAKEEPPKTTLVAAESLKLTVTQTSAVKPVYAPGDTLDFSAVVENQSSVDVEDARITFVKDGALAEPVKTPGTIKAGQASPPYAFHYTVAKEDVGTFTLQWDASAKLPEGVLAKPSPEEHAPDNVTYDYVTAGRVKLSFQAEAEEELEAAIAPEGDVNAEYKKEAYSENESVTFWVGAENTGKVTFSAVHISLAGVGCLSDGPADPGQKVGGGNAYTHLVHDSGDGYDYVEIKAEGEYIDENGAKRTVSDSITVKLKVREPVLSMSLAATAAAPESLVAGQIIPISVTIHNDGETPAYPSSYHLSPVGEGDSGNLFYGIMNQPIDPGKEAGFIYYASVTPTEEASHVFHRTIFVTYWSSTDASRPPQNTNAVNVSFTVGEAIVLPADPTLPDVSEYPATTAGSGWEMPVFTEEKEARIAALGDVKAADQKPVYTEGEWISIEFYALNSGDVVLNGVSTFLDGVFATSGGPVEPSHIFGSGVDKQNSYSHQVHDAGDGYDHIKISVSGEYTDITGAPKTVSDEVTLVLKVEPASEPVTVTHDPSEDPDPEEDKKPALNLVVTKLTAEPLHVDGMGNTPNVQYMLTITNVGEAPCIVGRVEVALPGGSYDSIALGGQTLSPGGAPINVPYSQVYNEAQADSDGKLHVTFEAIGAWQEQPVTSGPESLSHQLTQETTGWPIPDVTSVEVLKLETSTSAPEGYHEGEEITYSVSVTNTSDVVIPSLSVWDSLIGPGDLDTILNLQPNETRTFNGYSYFVTKEDVEEKGQVFNMAKVTWTDPLSGNAKSKLSNPVVVYTAQEKENQDVWVDIEYLEGPDNGAFYVENETFNIKVSWKNQTDETLYNVDVYDFLADWVSAAPDGYLLKGGTLNPGEDGSFTYLYTVEAIDVEVMKCVDDSAGIIAFNAAGEEFENYDFESKPADEEKKTTSIFLLKEETSHPKNGEYYEEGETITYKLTYTNDGEEALTDVRLYDVLNDSVTFSGFSTATIFYPTATNTYTFQHTVTAADVEAGQVRNSAYVLYSSLYATDVPVYSNTVTSLTGKGGEYVSGIGRGEGGSCVLTLTGQGDGATEYVLTPCAAHGKILKQVQQSTMKDSTDPHFAASGWNSAKLAWQQALNDMYQQLFDAAAGDARAAVMNERAAFLAYVNAQEALLAAEQPDQPQLAKKLAAELMMRKTAELCYLYHNAPDQRPDSRMGNDYDRLSVSGQAAKCERREEAREDGSVLITLILCDAHGDREAYIDGLVDDAVRPAEIENAFNRAARLYQSDLDLAATEAYIAAGDDLRPLIAQGRQSFDLLMQQEKTLLSFLYPDHPEIVAEVLSQAWRNALIDRCRTAAQPNQNAQEAPEAQADQNAPAGVLGTWYLVEALIGETSLSPAMLGMELSVELKADGTAEVNTSYDDGSETSQGTWEQGEDALIVTVDGQPLTFQIMEGTLQADLGGALGVFSQEKAEAEAAPQVIPAASEQAFLGTWRLTKIGMGENGLMPAAMLDVVLTMEIMPGKATARDENENATEYTTAFADGALTLSTPNPLFQYGMGEENKTLIIRTTDGDMLCYEEQFGDTPVTLYLEKGE